MLKSSLFDGGERFQWLIRKNLGSSAGLQINFWQPPLLLQSIRMASTLGKRKRRVVKSPEDDRQGDDEVSESFEQSAQEIFRRHFEAKFKPLPQVEKPTKVVEEELEDTAEEDSEWGGISDTEEDDVQVVDHTDRLSRMATMSKMELKSYMVRPLRPIMILC